MHISFLVRKAERSFVLQNLSCQQYAKIFKLKCDCWCCYKRHCFVSILFSENIENFYSFLLLNTSMLEVSDNTLYKFL